MTTTTDFRNCFFEFEDADEPIPKKSAIRQFLFTLGPEFQPLQNNFRLGSITDDWKTQDWPTLLILCRDFYNSVNPKGPSKQNQDNDSDRMSEADRNAHHKKIKSYFLNPIRYKSELEAEQKKYAGKCVYHLSKTQTTENCHVKKECDKVLASQSTSSLNASAPNTLTGQLRHLTEDIFEDACVDHVEDSIEDESNDTNEESLNYFSRVTNHYLRLAKNSPQLESRHPVQFPIIADSGANFHMFRDIEFFTQLSPVSGNVILGDGKTSVPISGIGVITLTIDGHEISIPDVRYVPDLAENIYSLFCHIQQPQHGLHSSFDEGLFIMFPMFRTKAILGRNDIYIAGLPHSSVLDPVVHSSFDSRSVPVCCSINHFSEKVKLESAKVDNLLAQLHQYYNEVKTRRQLNLEVPAGFRLNTAFQRMCHDAQLYLQSQSQVDCGASFSVSDNILPASSVPQLPNTSS